MRDAELACFHGSSLATLNDKKCLRGSHREHVQATSVCRVGGPLPSSSSSRETNARGPKTEHFGRKSTAAESSVPSKDGRPPPYSKRRHIVASENMAAPMESSWPVFHSKHSRRSVRTRATRSTGHSTGHSRPCNDKIRRRPGHSRSDRRLFRAYSPFCAIGSR